MKFKYVQVVTLVIVSFFIVNCGGSGSNEDTETNDDRPNVVIIFTDDMGYADLGVQGWVSDIKTPHIDSIAQNGVKMTHGYVTAPQCTPSRAAMVTGMYQQRFGVDDNRYTPMPLDVKTLGEQFQAMGYKTGMVGKWHLEIDQNSKEWLRQNEPSLNPGLVPISTRKKFFPNNRGYEDTYFGYINNYWTTFDIAGNTKTESYINNPAYRVDVVSDAAVSFIRRNHDKPFYLHVAHYAPHVPLEAPQKYLNKFPDIGIERRKYALSMISAVDHGVGRLLATLNEYKILDNTIVFFISDNGAPLGLDMTDAPIEVAQEAWDGSMNTPMVGEKGMLSDGGIRVPYLVQWPKKLPAGISFHKPISSLDAAYTALKASGASQEVLNNLDGIDIVPALTGSSTYLDQRALFWRFWSQSAVRVGKWKYLKAGLNREYLFDMYSPEHEHKNLLSIYPEKANELKVLLENWERTLPRQTAGTPLNTQEINWYNYFFR
jgi:arylsulfatase A-like enzyme